MNNIRTAVRLGAAFIIMMMMAFALTFFAIKQFNVMGDTTALITKRLNPQTDLSSSLLFYSADMGRLARNIILTDDAAKKEMFRQDYVKERNAAAEIMERFPPLITSEKGKQLFAELKKQDAFFFTFMDETVALGMANRSEEARQLIFGPRYQAQQDYVSALKALAHRQKDRVAEVTLQSEQQRTHAVGTMGAISVLVILTGSLLAWLITRSIVRPLHAALGAAQRIAQGDLIVDIPVKGSDETGRLLLAISEMQDSLARTVSTVRGNAESVAAASHQIAQGNTDLSQRTEEQASALEQTAATMSELSVTVRNNADNARQASQLAVNVRDVAQQGNEVTTSITGTMRTLGESSSRIANIIAVIDGIAFQTNILALNAAVEAARAGEQGRGFAVVAGEVRMLAQRSATAAGEIRQIIESNSVSVKAGGELAERSAVNMADILLSVRQLTETVEEITAASAEQARGIEQVGIAVAEMDGVTQQNASLVEESASASQNLRDQAALLLDSVSIFRIAEEPYAQASLPATTPLAHVTGSVKSVKAPEDWTTF